MSEYFEATILSATGNAVELKQNFPNHHEAARWARARATGARWKVTGMESGAVLAAGRCVKSAPETR